MAPMTDWQAWMLREIADVALSDPVRALEVIGPPALSGRDVSPRGLRPAGDGRQVSP